MVVISVSLDTIHWEMQLANNVPLDILPERGLHFAKNVPVDQPTRLVSMDASYAQQDSFLIMEHVKLVRSTQFHFFKALVNVIHVNLDLRQTRIIPLVTFAYQERFPMIMDNARTVLQVLFQL